MSDLSSSPETESKPSVASEPPPAAPAAPKQSFWSGRRAIHAALAVLALLLAAQWLDMRYELDALRVEAARRLQQGDASNAETKVLVKSLSETAKELQAKVSVLESKQAEAQSQQLALEQLYQDLAKNRDDWALAEIEQVLSTASQQLQLAGNVRGALIALQNADNRLSLSDKPQFITIRRAIARDMDKLKSLPSPDINGIALRLDSIIGQVDSMPLLADEKPSQPPSQPKPTSRRIEPKNGKAAARSSLLNDWLATAEEKWHSISSEMWNEVRQLIRVRSVETSDALLLSPNQSFYARENLKLRLLNARQALLSRNEPVFRSDMIAAQDAITKYFDTRAKQTQTALALLKQVQGSNLSIEMPTLSDSLNAVRNRKPK